MEVVEVAMRRRGAVGGRVLPSDGATALPEIGVLVLSGSSGRIESERARLFAEQGMSALTIRWTGSPHNPKYVGEVPLETFIEAIDLLWDAGARRIGILGLSKGSEAALLTAVRDPRVDVVVAVSPAAYVWDWSAVGEPSRSSWTWRGAPLPFIPMDDAWALEREDLEGPVAIRGYERSEHVFPSTPRRPSRSSRRERRSCW